MSTTLSWESNPEHPMNPFHGIWAFVLEMKASVIKFKFNKRKQKGAIISCPKL
jgi:hypothetical protein